MTCIHCLTVSRVRMTTPKMGLRYISVCRKSIALKKAHFAVHLIRNVVERNERETSEIQGTAGNDNVSYLFQTFLKAGDENGRETQISRQFGKKIESLIRFTIYNTRDRVRIVIHCSRCPKTFVSTLFIVNSIFRFPSIF